HALLSVVARLLDLELDVSPLDAAVRAFRTQCDQAVAQDTAVQAYVRQLEQAYDATGDETPRPPRDDDFNPEQLMHELEDFMRQDREVRGDACTPRPPMAGPGQVHHAPGEARTRPGESSPMDAAPEITRCCRIKGKF